MSIARSCCFGLAGACQFGIAVTLLIIGSRLHGSTGDECHLSSNTDTHLCSVVGWAALATILSSMIVAVVQGCLFIFCGSAYWLEVVARLSLAAAWGALSVLTLVSGIKADKQDVPHEGARHAAIVLCWAMLASSAIMVSSSVTCCCRCCRSSEADSDCPACLEVGALTALLCWWCAPKKPQARGPDYYYPRNYGGVSEPLNPHPHPHQPPSQQYAQQYPPAPHLTPHSGHMLPGQYGTGAGGGKPDAAYQTWTMTVPPPVQSHQHQYWPTGSPVYQPPHILSDGAPSAPPMHAPSAPPAKDAGGASNVKGTYL